MIKQLLFEGVGLTGTVSDSDIGNCRLRTAFHDDDGKPIVLEIYGQSISLLSDKSLAKYGDVVGFVDTSYYINKDEPIKDLFAPDILKNVNGDNVYFTWTKAGIIDLLKKLNTTVEDIKVDDTQSYITFTQDEKVYSYGDV